MLKISQIGLIIILLAALMSIILYSFSTQAIKTSTQACEAELATTCPHEGYIPPQTFLGILFLLGMGGLGVFLTLQKEPAQISIKSKIDLKSLDEEERSIYKKLVDSNGVVFQSELIGKTGLSKVKITRILDKMEAKNLVERRRRGMSNIVMLKR